MTDEETKAIYERRLRIEIAAGFFSTARGLAGFAGREWGADELREQARKAVALADLLIAEADGDV